ncbi:MAG: polyprenyl synthetase family protein [Christensenella sp.]|nr:MAG: polyprenyl synthetase family protein [Christensenella sp.]
MKISSVNKTEFLAMVEQSLKNAIGYGNFIIDEGMRYATLDGGKRVRPLCVYYGARATGRDAEVDEIVCIAVAIELIHNYSLVHDDLPAMDNDDYRRGKLSVHKKFGHANGILIGDQLLTLASCVLLDGARAYGSQFARAAQEITVAAKRMVQGQAIDLCGCQSEEDYLDMYSQKPPR